MGTSKRGGGTAHIVAHRERTRLFGLQRQKDFPTPRRKPVVVAQEQRIRPPGGCGKNFIVPQLSHSFTIDGTFSLQSFYNANLSRSVCHVS